MNHGIILHEEYRARMKKLGPERLGKLVLNMFRVDDGEEIEQFPEDEGLDVLSEVVCARLERDIKRSNSQSHNGKKSAEKRAKASHKSTKLQPNVNQTSTNVEPTSNEEDTNVQPLLPITNNLLPITNNLLDNNIVERDLFAEDVISYLNFKAGTHYRVGKESLRLIHGRMKEGYTTEDFKKVIDKKCKDWLGTDYEQFIRPSTLFAPSHFDQYLNQPEKTSTVDMLSSWAEGGNE